MPKRTPGITPIRRADGSIAQRAEVYDAVTKRRQCRTFDSKAAAVAWREDMRTRFRAGTARAVAPTKLRDVYNDWRDAVTDGFVRTRSGQVYKPSVRRSYGASFQQVWLPELGHVKVAELRTVHVQRVVDELVAAGSAAQTVRNHVTALRAVLKRAVRMELMTINPCANLALPAGGETRDRIANPSEALNLVQTIKDPRDRAIWAMAFFAGLRRGELMALRWEDVDLVGRRITVDSKRGNYDPPSKTFGAPKSKAGARTIHFPDVLLGFLTALDSTEGLVLGDTAERPYGDRQLARRCRPLWEAAGLAPITLHEARHTYASLMIASGCNIKAVQEWMGHSSITVTIDLYGHLLPGTAAEAQGLVNDYLNKELA